VFGGYGWGDIPDVCEQFEGGDPQLAGGGIICPELIDALLGDEVELLIAFYFDVIYVCEADSLLTLLQCLIGIV
jgi:hypothetical protein